MSDIVEIDIENAQIKVKHGDRDDTKSTKNVLSEMLSDYRFLVVFFIVTEGLGLFFATLTNFLMAIEGGEISTGLFLLISISIVMNVRALLVVPMFIYHTIKLLSIKEFCYRYSLFLCLIITLGSSLLVYTAWTSLLGNIFLNNQGGYYDGDNRELVTINYLILCMMLILSTIISVISNSILIISTVAVIISVCEYYFKFLDNGENYEIDNPIDTYPYNNDSIVMVQLSIILLMAGLIINTIAVIILLTVGLLITITMLII